MILTRDAILNIEDLNRETVEVPEWGGSVIVRELTGEERDQFEAARYKMDNGKLTLNMKNTRALLCAMVIVSENGNAVFDLTHVAKLGRKSGKALDRVYEVAQRLSGLDRSAEPTKNSESGPAEGSPSA